MITKYQKAINQIDDFFEYRYLHLTNEEIKKEVMGIIDNLNKEICER